MKVSIIATFVGSTLLAASAAQAVQVNSVKFLNDPSADYPGIQISQGKRYSHLLDFVADGNPDTINGVTFTAADVSGTNYSITGIGSAAGTGSGDLLGDFYQGNSSEVGHEESLVISGLIPDAPYDLRFYTGPYGSSPQTAMITNGTDTDTRTYDPGNNTQFLSYFYRTQGTSVTVKFTSLTDNNTFHLYAITNELLPEPSSLGVLAFGGLTLFSRRRRA